MSEEDHYDTPWEFLKRPTSVRLSSADVRLSVQPVPSSPTLPNSPSFSGQLVHIGNSPVTDPSRRLSLRDRRHENLRLRADEDSLLERNVDRVEAEKRLEGRNPGDFLLRYRSEGSAALSLRSLSGVLHIKLERRGEKWIVGEGPCFRSITQAVTYYRKHPLPIRGAEHLILAQFVQPPRT